MDSTTPQVAVKASRGTIVGARIEGIGAAVPDNVVTNHDLEQRIDTSDEWIRTRTGSV